MCQLRNTTQCLKNNITVDGLRWAEDLGFAQFFSQFPGFVPALVIECRRTAPRCSGPANFFNKMRETLEFLLEVFSRRWNSSEPLG